MTYTSEMMKNYLHAELISPQEKFQALQTADGHSLLFSIATDGNFYLTRNQSGVTSSGWTKTDLSSSLIKKDFPKDPNAKVKTFESAQSVQDGSIGLGMAISSSEGDNLYLSLSNSNSDFSWIENISWKAFPFDCSSNPISTLEIVNIFFCETSGGTQYIYVDVVRDPSSAVKLVERFYIDPTKSNGQYWVKHDLAIDLQIDADKYSSCLGRMPNGHVDGLYTAGHVGNSAQLIFAPVINYYGQGAISPIPLNLPNGVVPDEITSVRNADLSTDLFVVSGDSLYYFASSNQKSDATATLLLTNSVFTGTTKLAAMLHEGIVTIWGKNGNDQVYYTSCKQIDVGTQSAWSFPVPVLNGVEEMSPFVNLKDGGNTIFAGGNGKLFQISQDPTTNSKLWSTSEITLPVAPTSPAISFNSYTTTLQFNDENNLPLKGAKVNLSASRRCEVYINGLYYVITNNSIALESNSMGMITIMEATENITGTTFKVSSDGGDAVTINPMDKPFQKLADLGSQDGDSSKLKKATIDEGNGKTKPLVSPNSPNLSTVSSGLYSLGQSYQSVQTPSSTNAVAFMAIPVPMSAMSFGDDILMAAGDLFRWLESGVEAIVKVVKDAATAVWHFVATIGDKVYRAILDTVEAIVSAAEWVFNAIKTAIEDIIKFLEFLFEWDDIKRTKEVIHNLIKLWLQNEINGIQTIKQKIDSGINQLETDVNKWAGITDWSGIGDKVTKPASGSTNNPNDGQNSASQQLNHHFQNNAKNITILGKQPVLDPLESIIKDLITAIEDEAKVLGEVFEELKSLAENFSKLSVEEILKKLVAILVDGVLSSVQVVIDAILNILTDLAETALGILDTKLHIPIISDILNAIGIPDISFLDLFCWISGVAYTVVYKIAKGEAPFPDSQYTSFLISATSMDQIKAAMTSSDNLSDSSSINKETMLFAKTEDNDGSLIKLPLQYHDAIFIAGHSIGGFATFMSDFVTTFEALEETGDNAFAIPSAVLGIVAGGSIGAANFLVPRAAIQNKIVSYSSLSITVIRVVSKIIFSGPVQKKFGATKALSFMAAEDGRATGAIVDAVLVVPAFICTMWHFGELSTTPDSTDKTDAILDEISNLSSYISRIMYTIAVNDKDEETKAIEVGVMAVANIVTAGLQTAEAVVD